MKAEPPVDLGDDRRAGRLRGVAVVADFIYGAAGGGLHLRLRRRRWLRLLFGGGRVLRAGHHLRRMPRRLVPQVPLFRRRTVQPSRLRRLHRDVRGLRLGCPQKIAPTLVFRHDETKFLHHILEVPWWLSDYITNTYTSIGRFR